jgi:hypothetical protein
VTVSGTILVTPQSGGGTLSLTIKNDENNPVSSIAISEATPSLSGLTSPTFDYNGAPVNNSNVFPIGASASGQFTFTSGGVNVTQYKITVTVTLTNGQVDTGYATITAESK